MNTIIVGCRKGKYIILVLEGENGIETRKELYFECFIR